MQNPFVSRALRAIAIPLSVVTLLAACSRSGNPYAKLPDPPLTQGTLHAVTFVTEDAKFTEALTSGGYTLLTLAPNYRDAIKVEAMLWEVSEDVAGKVAILKGPPGAPDIRLLPVAPKAGESARADAEVMRDFYRNVIGTEVPKPPGGVSAPGIRVQVWTYLVPDIQALRAKLRAALVPPLTEPVAMTTAYLGDEKVMTMRAPDGAIVELVQAATQ